MIKSGTCVLVPKFRADVLTALIKKINPRFMVPTLHAVYFSHIEEVINKLPVVHVSCVNGVPYESQGETPKAYVVLKKAYEGTVNPKQQIIESCKDQLMPYSRPRSIEFIDKMQMTRSGKVFFRELEERERGKRRGL